MERPATTLLRLALRRAARGTGSQRWFFEQRTAIQPLPPLQHVLNPISWVLVGGLALRAYIPERMTQDVDILVHERDTEAVQTAFTTAGYEVVEQFSIDNFRVQTNYTATPSIHVLARIDRWLDEALSTPTYDIAKYPVLARAYLILLLTTVQKTCSTIVAKNDTCRNW